MKSFDLPENELKQIFSKMDINVDNKLDYTEFLVATKNHKMLAEEQNLKLAFTFIDKVKLIKDKDGKISSFDLQGIFRGNAHKRQLKIDKIIELFDKDKDRKINYDEFKEMMNKIFEEIKT